MPYVKYMGPDEREVPDLRVIVRPKQTIEVTEEQLPGLLCQDIWEETTATKSAEKAATPEEV